MKNFFLIPVLFLVTACSPKYEIKTHYTLPVDAQGKQCVKACSKERKTCQTNCNKMQDNCFARTKQSATDAYPSLMDEYHDVLMKYNYDISRYELEIASWEREERRLHQDFEHYRRTCKSKSKNSYECRRSHELDNELVNLEDHEPLAPSRPVKPSLANEIKNAQRTCNNNCGCEKEYDSCFVSCGGKLDYEKFCIENCK